MRTLRNLILLLAIIGTSLLAIYGFGLLSYFSLAPWDTAIFRPEIGTINRTVNDFFETGIGTWLIGAVWLFLFSVPVIQTLRHRWNAALRVLLTNLLLIVSGVAAMNSFSLIRNTLFPPYSGELTGVTGGYHNSIIPLAILFVLYVLWLREVKSLRQMSYASQEKSKNEQLEKAKNRLQDGQQTILSHETETTLATSGQLTSQ